MNKSVGTSLTRRQNTGFTVAELLVVVTVIAILATIIVVVYNGVQDKARESVARTDLQTLSQQMELFMSKNGHYPDSNDPPRYPEYQTVLKNASLYSITRRTSPSAAAERTYLFCPYKTNDEYAIIATWSVGDGDISAVGNTIDYVTSEGKIRQAVFQWDSTITGSGPFGKNLCKSVDPNFPVNNGAIWSYHIPTSYAP